MSQITRCPSCATTFKVVADQLRISEGWVRCGHCKEVFDASVHLVVPAPAATAPGHAERDPGKVLPVRHADQPMGKEPESGAPKVREDAVSSGLEKPPAPTEAVRSLEVPAPAVPAFLSAASPAPDTRLPIEKNTPFRWGGDHEPQVTQPSGSGEAKAAAVAQHPIEPPLAPLPLQRGLTAGATSTLPISTPGGYELPFAELREAEEEDWLSGLPKAPVTKHVAPSGGGDLRQSPYPALDLPRRNAGRTSDDVDSFAAAPESLSAGTDATADSPQAVTVDNGVAEESLSASLLSPPAKPPSVAFERPDDDDHVDDPLEPEVSFVVSARRKAFWRSPAMRLAMGLMSLLLLCALVLQTAIQERDRIAATEPRLRPWLAMLCERAGCELAPRRQIADVVIDSSSFNKARGDSYVLNLTLRNQAAIPLAMPAMELTLTDAQDQPVLRRVLLPHDMGAPAELSALGEWSASVAVVVTTGGARVAGYRLLAFYP